MTDKNKTLIAALLDRSGSMMGRVESTQTGFDNLIKEQKAERGTARVTLAQFDGEYELVYQDKPIDEVPPLSLVPRGSTALNDGIGRLVTSIGEQLSKMPEEQRPGLVVVVVMTDGHENSSKEWTAEKVKTLITLQETQYGWKFIFLGSGIDVHREGTALRGFSANSSMAYDANNQFAVASAYASTSNLIGSARNAVMASASMADVASIGYNDEDREASMGAGRADGESQEEWKNRLKSKAVSGNSK